MSAPYSIRTTLGMGILEIKKVSFAVVLSFSLAFSAQLTSGFTGRWETMNVFGDLWSIELAVAANKVTGTVNQGRLQVKILKGKVKGNTIEFQCTSPDGDRTISFMGIPKTDQIEFTRDVRVRAGGQTGDYGIFGMKGPRQFIAKRVKSEGPRGAKKGPAKWPPA